MPKIRPDKLSNCCWWRRWKNENTCFKQCKLSTNPPHSAQLSRALLHANYVIKQRRSRASTHTQACKRIVSPYRGRRWMFIIRINIDSELAQYCFFLHVSITRAAKSLALLLAILWLQSKSEKRKIEHPLKLPFFTSFLINSFRTLLLNISSKISISYMRSTHPSVWSFAAACRLKNKSWKQAKKLEPRQ